MWEGSFLTTIKETLEVSAELRGKELEKEVAQRMLWEASRKLIGAEPKVTRSGRQMWDSAGWDGGTPASDVRVRGCGEKAELKGLKEAIASWPLSPHQWYFVKHNRSSVNMQRAKGYLLHRVLAPEVTWTDSSPMWLWQNLSKANCLERQCFYCLIAW